MVAIQILRPLYVGIRDRVRRHPVLYAVVRTLKFGPFVGRRDGRMRRRLIAEGRENKWRMLNLGSGGRYECGMVNLDITPVTGPDVVGDGYELPFATGTFRLVVCDYVIEHVPDPERFLRGLADVIGAGGVVYLEVPFLQPRHGAPHDYTRWTRDGFRLLADRAGFDVRISAIHAGSAFTVFWILKEWFAVSAGFGINSVVRILRYVLSWLLCPLLIVDIVLPQAFCSETLANGFYFVLTPRSAGTEKSGPE